MNSVAIAHGETYGTFTPHHGLLAVQSIVERPPGQHPLSDTQDVLQSALGRSSSHHKYHGRDPRKPIMTLTIYVGIQREHRYLPLNPANSPSLSKETTLAAKIRNPVADHRCCRLSGSIRWPLEQLSVGTRRAHIHWLRIYTIHPDKALSKRLHQADYNVGGFIPKP